MNYDTLLEELFGAFPEIKEYVRNEEYLEGLPHCICDIVFVPYIIKVCKTGSAEKIGKICRFLEKMAQSFDTEVTEVLNVSVLEPLILDESDVTDILQEYMGTETKKELQYWKERYS